MKYRNGNNEPTTLSVTIFKGFEKYQILLVEIVGAHFFCESYIAFYG